MLTNIHASELADGEIDDARRIVYFSGVRLDADGLVAHSGDLHLNLRETFLTASGHDYGRSGLRQAEHDSFADAASVAGHDGAAAFQRQQAV